MFVAGVGVGDRVAGSFPPVLHHLGNVVDAQRLDHTDQVVFGVGVLRDQIWIDTRRDGPDLVRRQAPIGPAREWSPASNASGGPTR